MNGGYAEYAVARADFVYPLPEALDDMHVAPLLCAGLSVFEVCEWRAWSVERELDCLDLERRRILRSQFCARGIVMCMFRRAARATGNLLSL